ncbi:DNA repair protein RecN [Rubeoparvulum massiliense]|uniref:DNA repair protein RecN n=1 Tax=Rubeoparvulum massiliense TaxID=1631346 RepID=UPI00065E842A|nr:DNA repair protein RecN [Rubeoparvulum massiliense]
MLMELGIKNFALIKEVRLQFEEGLTILTGETGAGKSMLMDALSLLCGGRGSIDYVRYEAKKAEIEGLFHLSPSHAAWRILEQFGIEQGGEETLLLYRAITQQGKSICRINGQLVTLAILREIGEKVVAIHTQHEQQSLLQVERHIEWLDAYGEEELAETKQEYTRLYDEYVNLKREWKRLQQDEQELIQRIDLYRYQLQEIQGAQLEPDEDVKIEDEFQRLSHGEQIHHHVQQAYQALRTENRGMDWVAHAMSQLEEILPFEPSLQETFKLMESAYYQVEEVTFALRDYLDGFDFDKERLFEVSQRRDLIRMLQRKYGDSVNEILEYGAKIEEDLEQMEHRDERLQALERTILQKEKDLVLLAQDLSEIRHQVGVRLANAIEQELTDLKMERTIFQVAFTTQADPNGIYINGETIACTRQGMDKVEFLFSPNPGEPCRSLVRIASGGELSRILLAMKAILARLDDVETLVFDEVDTGVSGDVAQKIGEKLYRISQGKQVLSITHLPQVAAMADHHLFITKNQSANETVTKVNVLPDDERTYALAQLLSGVQQTAVTLEHANQMLDLAKQWKATYQDD